jgi:hypothetical protein
MDPSAPRTTFTSVGVKRQVAPAHTIDNGPRHGPAVAPEAVLLTHAIFGPSRILAWRVSRR